MKLDQLIVCNPSDDYKVLDTFEQTTFQEIDKKVILAKELFSVWSQKSLQDRTQILQKLLKALTQQQDEIARLIALEMGMPISIAKKWDVDSGLLHLQGYIDHAQQWLAREMVYETEQEVHTVYYEARGVVAASIPWNYPFSNFIWAVGQHLVVGNTIVIKHSEHSVLVTNFLEKIMNSISELGGCCQFVYGNGKDVGNYLMHSDVDMLWFTGSTQTGLLVYQAAAKKGIPVTLELGGAAPAIVLPDVDLEMAVDSIVNYRFMNSGQTCDGIKRLLVHESIYKDCLFMLVDRVKSKRLGNALDSGVDIGPLVSKRQLESIQSQVADALKKGAKVELGGKVPDNLHGAYYEPTILSNISFNMDVWTQEIFGPVLPIVPFSSTQEAIDLANDTQYGLGGYVYTQDQQEALKISQALNTGSVSINNVSYVIPQDPFGGSKPASGFSRVHGKTGLQSLCNIKTVVMKK